jgi:hypothetical protein
MSLFIPLTKGRVVIVGEEDHSFLLQWPWAFVCKRYAARQRRVADGPGPRLIYMHKAILARMYPDLDWNDPKLEGDHIDNDGLNNLPGNLRPITPNGNCYNRRRKSTNTSGFIGVSFSKSHNEWQAYLGPDAPSRYLGFFPTALEAALAREAAIVARGLQGLARSNADAILKTQKEAA